MGGKPMISTVEVSITDVVRAYNVNTNTWTSKANPPQPIRSNNGAVVLDGKICLSGGFIKAVQPEYRHLRPGDAQVALRPRTRHQHLEHEGRDADRADAFGLGSNQQPACAVGGKVTTDLTKVERYTP
jgi:hypothetical protein